MPVATATIGTTTIATSNEFKIVDGNVYFPPSTIKQEFFKESDLHTTCPWKGTASYYTIDVGDGKEVRDAAWFYPEAKEKAKEFEGWVAFYKSKVKVEKTNGTTASS